MNFESALAASPVSLQVQRTFPGLPFEPAPGSIILVCNYSIVFSSLHMEPVVSALIRACGDSKVDLFVVKPTPEWHRIQPSVHGADIDIEVPRRLYAEVESSEARLAPIYDEADVFAIVGASGTWAFWGDRSWDLAVLLAPARFRPNLVETGLFLDPSEDFVGALTPVGYPRYLSDASIEEFRRSVARVVSTHAGGTTFDSE